MIKKKLLLIFLLISFPFKSLALIEVDITRGNLNPLPLAVSSLASTEKDKEKLKKDLNINDLGLEIDFAVHSFTLETDKLIPLLTNEQKFTSINVFPIMERDVDFVFSESVETGNVSTKILDQDYPNLTDVFPIDIFRHKSLGSDHKSVTFHFRFQHPDKTLEDKEVSSVINKIKRLVLSEFDAKLRSSN